MTQINRFKTEKERLQHIENRIECACSQLKKAKHHWLSDRLEGNLATYLNAQDTDPRTDALCLGLAADALVSVCRANDHDAAFKLAEALQFMFEALCPEEGGSGGFRLYSRFMLSMLKHSGEALRGCARFRTGLASEFARAWATDSDVERSDDFLKTYLDLISGGDPHSAERSLRFGTEKLSEFARVQKAIRGIQGCEPEVRSVLSRTLANAAAKLDPERVAALIAAADDTVAA